MNFTNYKQQWQRKWAMPVLSGLLAAATLAVFAQRHHAPVREADVPRLCGWAGPQEAQKAYERLKGNFHSFRIKGAAQDNTRKRAVLWDAARLVNGNKHLPTFRQAIGDCVGAGAKQAVDYLQCVELIRTGELEFRTVFEPYHYACGRMAPECGRGAIRGADGSVGAWQAEALRLYGVISDDLPGLERYSALIVRRWATRMPEPRWLDEGKKHLVRSVAAVRSADEVRDAVCNGYPVTIASSWGGLLRPPVRDGRLVNRRVTTWMHQMCIIGYDGAAGREPYWYVLNSWGDDAHGTPPDDAPPGGFWIARIDVEFIVRQGDSFALSQFDGFPAQDWVVLEE